MWSSLSCTAAKLYCIFLLYYFCRVESGIDFTVLDVTKASAKTVGYFQRLQLSAFAFMRNNRFSVMNRLVTFQVSKKLLLLSKTVRPVPSNNSCRLATWNSTNASLRCSLTLWILSFFLRYRPAITRDLRSEDRDDDDDDVERHALVLPFLPIYHSVSTLGTFTWYQLHNHWRRHRRCRIVILLVAEGERVAYYWNIFIYF